MTLSDRLLTKKMAIIEIVNDELNNIAHVEHLRHKSTFVSYFHRAKTAYSMM